MNALSLSPQTLEGKKDARFEAKLSSTLKQLFQNAALLQGCDLTSFIMSAAAEKARAVVSESQSIMLNEKEHTAFMEIINNPPKATSAMKDLMNMEPLRER